MTRKCLNSSPTAVAVVGVAWQQQLQLLLAAAAAMIAPGYGRVTAAPSVHLCVLLLLLLLLLFSDILTFLFLTQVLLLVCH